MKKLIILIITACTLIGCGSAKTATQIVERVKQDTLYINQTQYDSIYVFQDKYVDRSRDTLYIKDKSVEFRYKLLRDTVYRTRVDSIPVIRTVEVTKEVRYIPWWSKILNWIGAIVIIILIVYLIYRIIKWKICI